MWSMTGMRSSKTRLLEPLPGRGVQDLAGAERPLERMRGRAACAELLAVAHQQPDARRRGEDAGDAFALDDRPHGIGVGVVDRTLVGERRRSRPSAARRRCSCGRRPSRCRTSTTRSRPVPEPEDPVAHRCDVDLVAAVRVDGELRLGGRARGGEDERGIVGRACRPRSVLALAARRGTRPSDSRAVAWRPGACRRATDDDHVLHVVGRGVERLVDDRL